jgi:hypothetical protein
MLQKSELLGLYRKADFGMVASMSNISLVPYEMLATGLPLIEFQDGTFPYFFPEDSAILIGLSYKDLYSKLKNAIDNPASIIKMQDTAKEYLDTLSWAKTASQFGDIIKQMGINCEK